MKTIRTFSLLAVLTVCALASNGIAEAATTKSPAKRIGILDTFMARAARVLHAAGALETDFLFSSMPRMTWGQIKAKYRNPDDPKGR